MTKLFKRNNILNLIYALIIAVPIFSILVRSAYIVVNKNAKDSYSSSGYVEKTSIFTAPNTMIEGETYTFKLNNQINGNINFVFYSDININWIDYGVPVHEYNGFCLYGNSYPLTYLLSYGEIGDNLMYEFTSLQTNIVNEFTFTYIQSRDNTTFNGYELINYQYQKATLDNAFDYSLSKFVDENSFGKLNFFEWFFDIFMDSNQLNNLYIRYVNWYMNYVLLVSCSYILFLVLMWFVNYSRRILERGLDYDW